MNHLCITFDLISLLPLFSPTNAALGRFKGSVSCLFSPYFSPYCPLSRRSAVLILIYMLDSCVLSPVWASGLWIPPGCLARVHPHWCGRLPPPLRACRAPALLQTHSSPSSPESSPPPRPRHRHQEKGSGKSPWRRRSPLPSALTHPLLFHFCRHRHHHHQHQHQLLTSVRSRSLAVLIIHQSNWQRILVLSTPSVNTFILMCYYYHDLSPSTLLHFLLFVTEMSPWVNLSKGQ